MSDWRDTLAPSVQFVRLLWCDAAGIRRCRVMPRSKLEAAAQRGVGLAYACFWLPAWGDCCLSDPACSPVGQMRLVPDITAAHVLPWMPSHAAALVTMCREPPHAPWECCPRTALRRVLAAAHADHGLTLQLGFELEFYLLRRPKEGETPAGLPAPLDASAYCSSTAFDAAAPVLGEMVSSLAALGVRVEQLHAESGPGQFEMALVPAPAAQAADALLFAREAVAAVAARHGLVACFLPKPLPGVAASGMHCHFSVWRGDDNLLRHDASPAPAAAGEAAAPPAPAEERGAGPALPGLDGTGEAFLAGVLAHLPALMPFTTPAPNSFRRLAPHAWTGAFQCWGPENREAPLRLCGTPGAPDAANAELKTFDATANPHLAAAALIVAGLQGVRRGLRLPPACGLDPGLLSAQQRAAAGIARLPASLGEAVAAFDADAEFGGALAAALGAPQLPRAFMAVRRSEWDHFGQMALEEEAAALYARY